MTTLTSACPLTVVSPPRLAGSLEAKTARQMARSWSPESPDPLLVGIDLVSVEDVTASVERLGRRYLYRIFTPHERACARTASITGYSSESLAARFAAKEAVVKVLRPTGARPEWRSIEVRRMDGGWCSLRLTGLAAALAAEAGITSLVVSVTHEPMVAAACVVGTRRGDAPAPRRTPPPDWRGR